MSEIKREIWSKQIFNQLVEAGISLFAYIPDFGNDNIIKLAEEHNETRAILLTSEEEGVGICAGADLVGRRAVLCMQSSGVGNCPNFLSLIKGGGFPIFLLVTMRGDYGEQNPWQYPMGQAVEPVLKAMGIQTIRVERQDELEEATTAAVSGAFKANQGIALVLSQKFLGTKEF